jgi:peptide/nickel transport system permease protein
MRLGSYILKRLALMAVVIFGVVIIVFVITRVIPADPVGAILGGNAPQALVDDMRHQLGLDKSIPAQLVDYLGGILHGDFGTSLKSSRPVAVDIMEYLPATIELAISSIIFAVIVGVLLGILSAVFRNKPIDHFSRVFSILGISVPGFWLGLLLLLVFYYLLDWLPGGGQLSMFLFPTRVTGLILLDAIITGQGAVFLDGLRHLILPTIVLGYGTTASIARIMRASMLDVLQQDYIRTARAKGLSRWTVIMSHATRNAMIPVITIIGLEFGSLLGGAVLTETIFSWPGLGRYIVNSLLTLDYPAVSGGTLFIAFIYSLVNVVVDILYAVLDPRMRV